MGKVTGTGNAVTPVLVQVQTMRGNLGHGPTFASVQAACTAYTKTLGKGAAPHVAQAYTALAPNTKGMQWQLALVATLARKHGATMVRLSVHNGAVALCGPQAAINATIASVQPAYNALVTAASNAYNPAMGNKVGYTNAWLCGAVAGLQVAYKVQTQLQYGLGYLYTFVAPSNGAAYIAGQVANSTVVATAPKTAPKPRKVAAPTVTAPSTAMAPSTAPQAAPSTSNTQAA